MKRFFFGLLTATGIISNIHAQTDPNYQNISERIKTLYPNDSVKVGAPCPDFTMNNVHYYKRKQVTLADLKGKNVILDFFNSGCVGCFRQMPKINDLKQKFGDNIEVFYVGLYDSKVEKVFERHRKAFNLQIPVVYDSILPWRFISVGYPEYLWIGEDGMIKAVTASEEVTEENLNAFVSGRPVRFLDRTKIADYESLSAMMQNPFQYFDSASRQPRYKIDDDTTCLFKSEFGSWNFEKHGNVRQREWDVFVTQGPNARKAIEISGDPESLYCAAYFGKYAIQPDDSFHYGKIYRTAILQGIDKGAFHSFRRYNYWYRLIDRRSQNINKEDLLKTMQSDLHKYFGYEVKVEERMMPCYKLVVTDRRKAARLKSKGGSPISKMSSAGGQFKNAPWKHFLNGLRYYGNTPEEPTYIDETGIDYNVDMEIEAALQSPEDVNRALWKYGLGLVKGEKLMKVLVVSHTE
jgi:thiol-disulfide isomerase/thioredoxin